jgi:predicted ATPase/DNA-binding CsgD family transcriptional regulator
VEPNPSQRSGRPVVAGIPAAGRPTAQRRHNLPAPLTSFVGRQAEVTRAKRQLENSRLLTLVGSGGIGKTRLALRLASELADQYADGVWLVQLAPVVDGGLVPWTVAAALGVNEQPGRPIRLSLAEYLSERQTLLILDNCEHVVAAVAEAVGGMLQDCPPVKILATSRQALGVEGESLFFVPGLSLPESASEVNVAGGEQFGAIRLFVDRATSVVPDFRPTSSTLEAVADICRRLDGVPLAIELAATRLKLLGAEQLAARLDDRFQLLVGGSRTAPGRHQTLRATLDWSYQLLTEPERTLLRRLAAFTGGWSLAAAEEVASGKGIETRQVLSLLEQLLDKSLVVIDAQAHERVRFRFLETIRQYAWERLLESGEADFVRQRHLDWCVQLAKDIQPPGMHHPWHAHDSLQEQDNLRSGLLWAIQQGEADAGLRVAVVLAHLWYMRGHYSEGRARLAELLALPSSATSPEVRASALTWAGFLAYCQGDLATAHDLLDTSLDLWHVLGNDERTAVCLHQLGNVVRFRGDLSAAQRLLESASAINHRLGHGMRAAMNLALVAQVLFEAGDFTRAEKLNRQSLSSLEAAGPGWGTVLTMCMQGRLASVRGDREVARQRLEESVELGDRLGITRGVVWSIYYLAQHDLGLGNAHRAREEFAESLRLAHQTGDLMATAHCLEGIAGALAATQPGRATRLAGGAAALRESMGSVAYPADQQRLRRWLDVAERRLAGGASAAAFAEGTTMPLDRLVTYALGADEVSPEHGPNLHGLAFGGLSSRELEVLRLVALARSNREIASELVLSEKTVERHLSHIFTKLQVSSRTAAARLAVDAGIG